MPGASHNRASHVEVDGALVRSDLPGYSDLATKINLDQAPFIYQSTLMTYATLIDANNGVFISPCDLEIMGGKCHVVTAVVATGDGGINIGTPSDSNKYLAGYDVATTYLASQSFNISATEFADTTIDAGEQIDFELMINTSAGGAIHVALVTAPR
jgi:hypothetical protein